MTKKKIAIFTTTQGHKSIAEAIHETLKDQYEVVTFFEIDATFEGYNLIYKYAPFLFIAPFRFSNNTRFIPYIKEFFKQRYRKKITQFYAKHIPDLLINTLWMYEGTLEEISVDHQIPLINVLADPKTIHPALMAEPPFLNVGFDQGSEKQCKKCYPSINYQSLGWFVRPVFEEKYVKSQVQQELKLNPSLMTLLFVAGSEGTETVFKTIHNLRPSKPIQILVACGKNEKLFKKVFNLASSVPNIDFLPISFTSQIQKYMQAADLIVGKAGPNMLFESVATHTPFFATTHIAGQEDGNLALIHEYKLGFVEENPEQAALLIEEIIDKPEKLNKLKEPLERLAAYNRAAKPLLLKLVEQLLTK